MLKQFGRAFLPIAIGAVLLLGFFAFSTEPYVNAAGERDLLVFGHPACEDIVVSEGSEHLPACWDGNGNLIQLEHSFTAHYLRIDVSALAWVRDETGIPVFLFHGDTDFSSVYVRQGMAGKFEREYLAHAQSRYKDDATFCQYWSDEAEAIQYNDPPLAHKIVEYVMPSQACPTLPYLPALQ